MTMGGSGGKPNPIPPGPITIGTMDVPPEESVTVDWIVVVVLSPVY